MYLHRRQDCFLNPLDFGDVSHKLLLDPDRHNKECMTRYNNMVLLSRKLMKLTPEKWQGLSDLLNSIPSVSPHTKRSIPEAHDATSSDSTGGGLTLFVLIIASIALLACVFGVILDCCCGGPAKRKAAAARKRAKENQLSGYNSTPSIVPWTGYAGTACTSASRRPGSQFRAYNLKPLNSDSITLQRWATPSTYRGPYATSNSRQANQDQVPGLGDNNGSDGRSVPGSLAPAVTRTSRDTEVVEDAPPAYKQAREDKVLVAEAEVPSYNNPEVDRGQSSRWSMGGN